MMVDASSVDGVAMAPNTPSALARTRPTHVSQLEAGEAGRAETRAWGGSGPLRVGVPLGLLRLMQDEMLDARGKKGGVDGKKMQNQSIE